MNIKRVKAEIRKRMFDVLKSRDMQDIKMDSSMVLKNLINTHYWDRADILLTYLSIKGEVDTKDMIHEARRCEKKVGVPRIKGEDLIFYFISNDHEQYGLNRFNIPEPEATLPRIIYSKLNNKERVLLVVPGIAFDKQRFRLGRGGGYYDRTIKHLREEMGKMLVVAGVCFYEQLVKKVPCNRWDESVDYIVTNKGIL